jgi:AraC-like DNA-binding protein
MKKFEESKSEVVDVINDHRAKSDVSVKSLAKDAGCSQSGLNAVLNEDRGVSFDLLMVTLKALGYHVELKLKHRTTGVSKIEVNL